MRYKNHDTPCIGICSTIYGDEVCRGCKRSSDEVIIWNTLPLQHKDAILSRLDDLTEQITAQKLIITDSDLLANKLKALAIRYRPEFSPYCWAYTLLRQGADKIHPIEAYGIEIKNEFKHLNLMQIFSLIDSEIYALSEAQLLQQK